MPVSVRRFRLFPVSIGQAFLWALLPSLVLLLSRRLMSVLRRW